MLYVESEKEILKSAINIGKKFKYLYFLLMKSTLNFFKTLDWSPS